MMRALLLSLGLAFGCPVVAALQASPGELLPLVPDDYTFCLVAHKAAAELNSPRDSKFAKAFWASPLIREIESSNDVTRLLGLKQQLVRELGTTEAELRELIFGGTLVMAYRKPADGDLAKETGLFILKTDKPKALRDTVDRVNQLQVRSGELRAVEEVKHKTPYFRRAKSDAAAAPEYYWIDNGLLIFTSSETLLREVIERRSAPVPNPVAATRHKSLGLETAPVAVLVNPRSFDREIEAGAREGERGEKQIIDLFAKTWKAIDHFGFFLSRKPDLTCGVAIACDPAKLPPAVRMLLAGLNQPLKIWDRLPESNLFAMALPLRPRGWDELLKVIAPPEDHNKLRETVVTALRPFGEDLQWESFLDSIGPEMALWVSPPDAKAGVVDPSVAVAVMLDPARAAETAKMMTDGLDFLARFLSLSDRQYKTSTIKEPGYVIRKMSHPDFPAGVEPCFTIREGTLLIASHPRMIAGYKPAGASSKPSGASPLMRMSSDAWAGYLKESTPRLAVKIAGEGGDAKKTEVILNHLIPILRETDRVELNISTEPNRAVLRLQLIEKPSGPVK